MDWSQLGLEMVEILLPILTLALTALIGLGVSYLRLQTQRINSEIARDSLDAALAEAEKVARDAVLATQQKLVDSWKAASSDGKLTEEEARQAMQHAADYFMTHLSGGSISILRSAIGPLEAWLYDLIEAKVSERKDSVSGKLEAIISPFSSPKDS